MLHMHVDHDKFELVDDGFAILLATNSRTRYAEGCMFLLVRLTNITT